MSWIYSIIFAGLVFSTENNLQPAPVDTNYNAYNTNAVVALDETEKFEQIYPLTPDGRVCVSNVNGSITIETWDSNQVKLEAVKTADSKERLAEVEIKVDAKPDYLKIETNYGNLSRNGNNWRNGGKLEVQYRLTVPRNAVLNEIQTVNGSVNISNAQNLTKASAVNGLIKAVNLRGTASLSTVNGTIEADFDALQADSKISLNTVNGKVHLTIPSDADATLRANSVNGNIVNEFGLPVRKGQYVGRDLYGRIGSGETQIRLSSVNGELAIKRKADGKNPNSAVNLLEQNSRDNSENDADSQSRASRTERQANRDLREAERQIREAEREIAKVNEEINRINAEITPVVVGTVNVAISEEIQVKIEEVQRKQQEALTRMSQINWTPASPTVERKNGSFTVKKNPKVTIDAKNCTVNVRGWDKSEVQYTITKISRNRTQTPLDIKTENSDSAVEIKVSNAESSNELNRTVIEVYVPKKSNLRVVTNREIRLEGVSGEIDLKGEKSSVNVRDADGKLNVATTEGKIRVIGFRGEIFSTTDCGEMDLDGDFQKLTAQTVEGKITLTLPENINAVFNSDVEIEAEGFNLVRENEDEMRWRIGKGGAEFNLKAADGEIFIRNSTILRAN